MNKQNPSSVTLDGYLQVQKAFVAEEKSGGHKMSVQGTLLFPEIHMLVPVGTASLKIGREAIDIHAEDLTGGDGVLILQKGAYANVTRLKIDAVQGKFAISACAMKISGVPLRGNPATAHDLYLCIEIPISKGRIILDATVVIRRSSPWARKWKC